MYTVYLNGEEVITFINNLKRKIKYFLLISLLGNRVIAGFYTAQYEQAFDVPAKKENKRLIRVKAPVNDIIEAGKNEAQPEQSKRPKINYFAGPHCIFDPHFKY